MIYVQTHPPFSPRAPQKPPVNLPGAIRQHLTVRKIWQVYNGSFALTDVVSRQVRRDTLRFRARQEHWLGV